MDTTPRTRKPRNAGLNTPLMQLLRICSPDQRQWLAEQAGTNVNYLYAIAGCHRQKISVQLAVAIEEASQELHTKTRGKCPVVTARQIASMCAIAGFDDVEVE